jgi:hypothetical protein
MNKAKKTKQKKKTTELLYQLLQVRVRDLEKRVSALERFGIEEDTNTKKIVDSLLSR